MNKNYNDNLKDIHGPIKLNMLDVLHKQRDFYLKEIIQLKDVEEEFLENIKNPKIRKKYTPMKMSTAIWLQFIHEMEVLYTILYQLVEHFQKDIGALKTLEKETEFFNDDRIKWALKEFHQMVTKTDKEFDGGID